MFILVGNGDGGDVTEKIDTQICMKNEFEVGETTGI